MSGLLERFQGHLGLTEAERVCCDGATRGGAAAGKFDEVYLVRNGHAWGAYQRVKTSLSPAP